MKKVICLILLLSSILYSGEVDKDGTKRIFLSGMIISTWVAVGINEGLKWRDNEDLDLILKGDYHVYRAVTGFNLISTPRAPA